MHKYEYFRHYHLKHTSQVCPMFHANSDLQSLRTGCVEVVQIQQCEILFLLYIFKCGMLRQNMSL